ncbi:MAG: amino acid permease, partial [Deltaproteobacteria bacterium]|nr:amino acid permease [Deltaproteobacteria bacterium]
MAAKSNKFGAFGGVCVPSILTILGVIMYLRLPRLIGEGGLYQVLGIIVAAHVISITTGLSISSIATDKKVGAGGPYYIVSRSLGLPIGGTLGLALFVGLAFSISLYIIGFCESFLPTIGVSATPDAIRLWGTGVLVVVSIVTLISTSLALKMQYVILGLIVLSVGSIALGSPDVVAATPALNPTEDGPSFALLFGIFFPAVTGFTAGVNMSGDLANPKRAIPLGTLTSIVVGLIVYVGLAIFVAYRVPVDQLVGNPAVLVDIALVPVLVLGGIWGATISSAMGSILGAPRILQALSEDRVTPRFFAVGAGAMNEPRRALIFAALIAETGILVGELDAIARIVSMFFIATYGFLNLSCAIESWVRADFGPTFQIPRMVSVVGGVSCLLVMIQLDLAAAIGAMVLFAGVFFVLKRRELSLESGDAWGGVWFSMVRANLERLREHPLQAADYRPNVMAFGWQDSPIHPQLVKFGANLVSRLGMLTDVVFEGREGGAARRRAPSAPDEEDDLPVAAGVFHYPVSTADPFAVMDSMVRHYGFAGLEPNTILLGWDDYRNSAGQLVALLATVREQSQNAILWAPKHDKTLPSPAERRVDVWWSPDRGSFAFGLALTRILTGDEPWHLAQVRFLLVNDRAINREVLHWTAQRLCREARINASIKVLSDPTAQRSYGDWVRRESPEADLVLLALPSGESAAVQLALSHFDSLLEHLGHVLVLQPSPSLPKILAPILATEKGHLVEPFTPLALPQCSDSMADLKLPEDSRLSNEILRISTALGQLADDLSVGGLAPVFRGHQQLIKRVENLVAARFDQLERALATPGARQKRTAQVEASLLRGTIELTEQFEEIELPSYRSGVQ